MKWQSQRRKVEALASQATQLSRESQVLKQELRDKTIAQLRRPETLVLAFAAGVIWMSNPATKHLGRAQTVLRFVSTSSSILRLMGIPLPVKPAP